MGRAVSAQIFHFRLGQHQIEFAFDLGLFVKGCFRLFQPGLNSPNAVKVSFWERFIQPSPFCINEYVYNIG